MDTVAKTTRAGGKRLILVVEDNDLEREMLSIILSDEYETVEARDGVEGLEILEERYEDLSLILLDVFMPRCNGFEFLKRKREDARYDSLPTIVMTASGAVEDEMRCLELGANDFLTKPYNAGIMLNRIRNTIRLRETASIVNHLTYDQLTGLYNMEFFYAAAMEEYASQPDCTFDFVASDINNFRSLNDRHGSEHCDELLRQLAIHLRAHLPGVLVGGRSGGDTFAFMTEHYEGDWNERVQEVMDRFAYHNMHVKFGVMEGADPSMPVSVACNRAMSALKNIKDIAGTTVSLFDEQLHQSMLTEQTILESMESALEEGQFKIVYQPKFDVQRGRIGGAEALVRWIHPTLGFVSPGVFIPIFERNGFIVKLDLYVWEHVCMEIKRWEKLGLEPVPVSINASRIDFDDINLAHKLADLSDHHGVDRSLLHIELTETAFSDNPESVTKVLNDFRELGFSTELDDFGSGYSSLASLNTMPLDVMKLDMSIVQKATELNDFRIVEASINLARTLGLGTVIEGVELMSEAERVRELGCDYIQGYFYSRPLPAEEFEACLADPHSLAR